MSFIEKNFSKQGLKFTETMYGEYVLDENQKIGTFTFTVNCHSDNLYQFFEGDVSGQKRKVSLEGKLRIEDYRSTNRKETNVQGSLILFEDNKLKYEFDYTDPFDKKKKHYHGNKNINYLRPIHSMTNLYGQIDRITEDGPVREAEVESHFKLRELLKFLGTFSLKK